MNFRKYKQRIIPRKRQTTIPFATWSEACKAFGNLFAKTPQNDHLYDFDRINRLASTKDDSFTFCHGKLSLHLKS